MPVIFSAMSYGSISYNAHKSLALAATELGILYNHDVEPVKLHQSLPESYGYVIYHRQFLYWEDVRQCPVLLLVPF